MSYLYSPSREAEKTVNNFMLDLINSKLTLNGVLALTTLILILVLAAWHRNKDSHIDLRDLVCEQGRLDEKKFARFGAWIVSTWGFVYLIVEERFSEWYFAGYMAAWVGSAIIDRYVADKSQVEKARSK